MEDEQNLPPRWDKSKDRDSKNQRRPIWFFEIEPDSEETKTLNFSKDKGLKASIIEIVSQRFENPQEAKKELGEFVNEDVIRLFKLGKQQFDSLKEPGSKAVSSAREKHFNRSMNFCLGILTENLYNLGHNLSQPTYGRILRVKATEDEREFDVLKKDERTQALSLLVGNTWNSVGTTVYGEQQGKAVDKIYDNFFIVKDYKKAIPQEQVIIIEPTGPIKHTQSPKLNVLQKAKQYISKKIQKSKPPESTNLESDSTNYAPIPSSTPITEQDAGQGIIIGNAKSSYQRIYVKPDVNELLSITGSDKKESMHSMAKVLAQRFEDPSAAEKSILKLLTQQFVRDDNIFDKKPLKETQNIPNIMDLYYYKMAGNARLLYDNLSQKDQENFIQFCNELTNMVTEEMVNLGYVLNEDTKKRTKNLGVVSSQEYIDSRAVLTLKLEDKKFTSIQELGGIYGHSNPKILEQQMQVMQPKKEGVDSKTHTQQVETKKERNSSSVSDVGGYRTLPKEDKGSNNFSASSRIEEGTRGNLDEISHNIALNWDKQFKKEGFKETSKKISEIIESKGTYQREQVGVTVSNNKPQLDFKIPENYTGKILFPRLSPQGVPVKEGDHILYDVVQFYNGQAFPKKSFMYDSEKSTFLGLGKKKNIAKTGYSTVPAEIKKELAPKRQAHSQGARSR